MSEYNEQSPQSTAGRVVPRILIAHDRLMERDALARTLSILRPHFSATAIPPHMLRKEIQTEAVCIVICTTLTSEVEAQVPAWILLHEDGTNRCVVSIDGEQVEHDTLSLPEILEVLDRVTA